MTAQMSPVITSGASVCLRPSKIMTFWAFCCLPSPARLMTVTCWPALRRPAVMRPMAMRPTYSLYWMVVTIICSGAARASTAESKPALLPRAEFSA